MADLERMAGEVQQTRDSLSEAYQTLSEHRDEWTRLHNQTAEAITALNQHVSNTLEERLNLASKIEDERTALLRSSIDRLNTQQETSMQSD